MKAAVITVKRAYPVILSQGEKFTVVFIPDFNINTQGTDIVNAIEMARDTIGIMGIDMEDDNEHIPTPSDMATVRAKYPTDMVTFVDVDFAEYRRKNDLRTVRKNCTIPSWLNFEAEKAGVNFSLALQTGLKQELRISDEPSPACAHAS